MSEKHCLDYLTKLKWFEPFDNLKFNSHLQSLLSTGVSSLLSKFFFFPIFFIPSISFMSFICSLSIVVKLSISKLFSSLLRKVEKYSKERERERSSVKAKQREGERMRERKRERESDINREKCGGKSVIKSRKNEGRTSFHREYERLQRTHRKIKTELLLHFSVKSFTYVCMDQFLLHYVLYIILWFSGRQIHTIVYHTKRVYQMNLNENSAISRKNEKIRSSAWHST